MLTASDQLLRMAISL